MDSLDFDNRDRALRDGGILTGTAVIAGRLLGIDIDVNHLRSGHSQYEEIVNKARECNILVLSPCLASPSIPGRA